MSPLTFIHTERRGQSVLPEGGRGRGEGPCGMDGAAHSTEARGSGGLEIDMKEGGEQKKEELERRERNRSPRNNNSGR